MVHNNDDAMNKIPLKSASGLDDEEKQAGEFVQDTETAEEARREQRRANLLKWMKKLTIVFICFIGIALISYIIITLCFSDDKSSTAQLEATSTEATSGAQLVTTVMTTLPVATTMADTSSAATTSSPASTREEPAETTLPVTATATTSTTTSTTSTTTTSTTTTTTTTTRRPTPPPNFEDTINLDVKFESKLGQYDQAAVCSDKEVCSRIGSNILERDGSAVDAAIATMLCIGITTMHSMGIGGGMLMNVYLKGNQHAYSIDAREVAPYAATPEMFSHNDKLSLNGGLSIAVPGELMGYYRAHERFGRLPWKTLVAPSVKLCRDGVFLTQHQHDAFEYRREHLKNNTLLMNIFTNPTTGQLHPVGTKLKLPQQLCDTYEMLAENGPLDFYNGTLSKLVMADLEELGSIITSYDLESYTADLVSSITMQLGDDILYAMPPISSGTVIANILSVLEGFNLSKADLQGAEREATTIHRIAEALKFGFAKRWELGDLRFNDVRELISKLTTPENGYDIRAQINDSAVLEEIFDYGAQFMGVDDVGTSSVVVLAPNGDAVSVTSSINDYFGCSQAGTRTGIIFNSAMNDFSIEGKENMFGLPPAPSNFIDSSKRPMSSMSPLILASQQGDVHMAISAAGGSRIISAIVEVAARVLWLGQDIKQAIDAPRFHHQLVPNVLEYQKGGFSFDVLKLLQDKGHIIKPSKGVGSVVYGIVRNSTGIFANADYRKRGDTVGF